MVFHTSKSLRKDSSFKIVNLLNSFPITFSLFVSIIYLPRNSSTTKTALVTKMDIDLMFEPPSVLVTSTATAR